MSHSTTLEIQQKIEERYWLNLFKDCRSLSLFSYATLDNAGKKSVVADVPKELSILLDKVSKRDTTATFALLLTALHITISKCTSFNDPLIVSVLPTTRDNAVSGKDALRFFRTTMDKQGSSLDLLHKFTEQIMNDQLTVLTNLDTVIDKYILLERGNRKDLFQIGLQFGPHGTRHSSLQEADILYAIETDGEQLRLSIQHPFKEKYSGFIQRMAHYYLYVLEYMVKKPKQCVGDIPLASAEETKVILKDFNETPFPVDASRTVMALVEEQVLRSPGAIAVSYESKHLTYQALNEAANKIAHCLTEKYHVVPGDMIGIKLDRSENIVTGILGILKTGAAYVPIDLSYPIDRLQYILDDAQCKIFITESAFLDEIRSRWQGPVEEFSDLKHDNVTNPPIRNVPGDAIYAIYTSGSTGKPKGVVQTHACLSSLLQWQVNCGEFGRQLKVLQWSSISFDASIHEILFALMSGGEVQMVREETRSDLHALGQFMAKNGTQIFWQAASALNILFEISDDIWNSKALQYIVSTAEQLKLGPGLTRYLKSHPQVSLHNFYGPSETHVVTFAKVVDYDTVYQPIGKPVPNSRVYLLSGDMEVVPVGIPAEVFMAGDCLAAGYLNKKELTAGKFFDHPITLNGELVNAGDQRVYKSGDVAIWWPDGTLQYLGRSDDQIKIRGYRVELGEIASSLLQLEYIKEAAVVARTGSDATLYIVAYLISDASIQAEELRNHLRQALPEYMIPSYFIQVPQFPLTPTGKIDKKALPDPESLISRALFAEPRTSSEKKLAAIWKDVLLKDPIGINDTFLELGGHSLKAAKILSRIYKDFHVQIQLRSIFQYPTIEKLAGVIDSSESVIYHSITPVQKQPYYDVSHAQKRIWVSDQVEKNTTAYNVSDAYAIRGYLDEEALHKAFSSLVERHEILRTTFTSVDFEPKQIVHDPDVFPYGLEVKDIRSDADRMNRARTLAAEEARRAFNLEKGPLIRVTLLRVEDDAYALLITTHHIISDLWSKEIMIKELVQFYDARVEGKSVTLQPLTIQYKDFVAWHLQQLSGENLVSLRNFWCNQFSGGAPVLDFPTDYPRPAMRTERASTVSLRLDKQVSTSLRSICVKNSATLFMVLVAAVKTCLYRYTRQQTIIVGTPVSIRDHEHLENQLGLYLNTLPLKTTIAGNDTFNALLHKVNATVIAAFEHQQFPFDLIVEELHMTRDVSRSPLFDAVVVLGNAADVAGSQDAKETGDLSVSTFDTGLRSSNVDLRFVFGEEVDHIYGYIEYNIDLFKRESMNQLADRLVTVFTTVAAEEHIPLDKIGVSKDSPSTRSESLDNLFSYKF